jgi:hypothetical protein
LYFNYRTLFEIPEAKIPEPALAEFFKFHIRAKHLANQLAICQKKNLFSRHMTESKVYMKSGS